MERLCFYGSYLRFLNRVNFEMSRETLDWFVKYVDPVKIVYLSEDEIEEIFEHGFLQTIRNH